MDFYVQEKKPTYICVFAGKCPLQMSCDRNDIFIESFVKSEPEMTDDDLKSEDNQSYDSNNDSSKQTTPKEAQKGLHQKYCVTN